MTVVSLFSGAGGLDLGLLRAGHRLVYANDNDASAVATYRRNIGEHIECADIKDINLASLPDADVVVGGFPCQGFSQANRFRNMDDERNKLYTFFYKTILIKQPRFFIAENVKGILSLGGGEAVKTIIEDFRKAGYSLEIRLVNMADYGVPQARQRVLFVGQRNGLSERKLFRFPVPTHGRNGSPKPWKSIEEAIGHLPDPDTPNDIPNHVYSAYKLAFRNFTGHRPTNKDKPSPTILARGNGGGGVCAIPHYNGKRRLTIRESASVQTFPEDFVFEGQMNACYRQIGNAVPVLFAEQLGRELARIEKEELKP
jgi:DNA (cytosine-5)-methyltransferase 1